MTRDGGWSAMVNAPAPMEGERPATNRLYVLLDGKGYVIGFHDKARMPTRDELIDAEMKTAQCTPRRDARGWSYFADERYLTLEEASARVDHYLASIRGGQTE